MANSSLPPTLSHATAYIAASETEINAFLTDLNVSPHDTVTLDARVANGIKDIRDFNRHLLLSPQFGDTRLGLIYHADALTPPAQSALLKLLEEPPVRVKIVLFIDAEAEVLPTVLSRCQRRYGRLAAHSLTSIAYNRDVIAQFVDSEALSKQDDLDEIVKGWLASAYNGWCAAGRPLEGIGEVERFWTVYRQLGSQTSQRLLLEQLVVSSL